MLVSALLVALSSSLTLAFVPPLASPAFGSTTTTTKASSSPLRPVATPRTSLEHLTVLSSTLDRAAVETAGSVAKSVAQQLKQAPAEDDEDAEATADTADGIVGAIDTLLGYIEDAIKADGAQSLGYAKYPNYPTDPKFDLSAMMPMLDGPPPFSMWFKPGKLGRLVWRLVQTVLAKNAPKFTQDKWMKVFGNVFLLPTPITGDDLWETDAGFAQQYLSGTNPVMIKRVKSVKDDLKSELIKALGGEKTLGDLAKAENLYYVTYDGWDSSNLPRKVYSKPEKWPELYFYNPTVVFSVKQGDDKLTPMGIQIENKVFLPGEKSWTYAKMLVANADENVHEWISHLGKTHLTVEPQIVAAINQLKKFKHPLYDFLEPHYKDTLFLSWAARLTLLYYVPSEDPNDEKANLEAAQKSNSVADTQFSVGAANFLKCLLSYWDSFTFDQSAFDTELKSRGFDPENPNIPNYFYAEDGLKLWNAIGQYTSDFVDSIYESDLKLKDDTRLQAWAAEVADPERANIKGFPSPMPDKPTLARCLQTTIWVASGLHAAVNFPQFDYMAYQPNRPCAFRTPLSDASQDLEWVFQNSVSTKTIAFSITQIIWLLTLPSDHTLGDLKEPKGTLWEGAYDKFQSTLSGISKDINKRNDKLSTDAVPFPYTYLDPPNVPASIDI